MNWIIKDTSKLKYHTNLSELLKPIEKEIQDLKWLVSDLEINSSEMEQLPINHQKDWFIISSEEMKKICKTDTQIIWGVFSGFDNKTDLKINREVPYVDGNEEIWESGNLQLENSKIEIIAWDSSYTIVKFTQKEMSEKFKEYFEEAIELENFK